MRNASNKKTNYSIYKVAFAIPENQICLKENDLDLRAWFKEII